ncbi:hypothetical protein V7O62_01720 [Methanolobus sp. ZRKC2]|uniref:hypothetical protein n=1 Tax=Methanolobus sp. ZRKC2 TaxID=3125783 RepID=UPI00324BBE13
MVYLLVKHKVKDFSKWKPGFDEYSSKRKETGSKGGMLFRTSDDPNEVEILLEWDTLEDARKFNESKELEEKMKELGVIGNLDISVLDKVEDLRF